MPKDKSLRRSNTEKLLKEITDNYRDFQSAWNEIRNEARIDMCLVTNRPWEMSKETADEAAMRRKYGRPILSLDETTQYLNRLRNSFRQNRRSIQVEPAEMGTESLQEVQRLKAAAKFKAGLIRQIEYKSRAQQAYSTAFDSAAERSYGWFGIGRRYLHEMSFDQELYIFRIANANSVCPDPSFREMDASDMKWLFYFSPYTEDEFERNWPDAEIKSFGPEIERLAPEWHAGKIVQVAEYWKYEIKRKTLLQFQDGRAEYLDDGSKRSLHTENGQDYVVYLPGEGNLIPVERTREVDCPSLCKYITNGFEILEKEEWPGRWIPYVPVFGKEVFVDNGSGSKRCLESFLRHARDPVMLYNYYRTTEAEVASMTPKSKFIVLEGQIDEKDQDDWANAHRIPKAYLTTQIVHDPETGQPIPQMPQPINYEPPIQALELGAESARRAIQAAMGLTPLPTAAQRLTEKSGIALERIEAMQDLGSLHFHDNANIAMMHGGRILDDLIDKVYDTNRVVNIRDQADNQKLVRINGGKLEGQEEEYHVRSEQRFDVAISVGPHYQTQHDRIDAFTTELLSRLPAAGARILDLIVKMKEMGPLGDEMATRLTPPEFMVKEGMPPLPPQAAIMLRQMQQQLQIAQQTIQALQQELSRLMFEQKAKAVESQSRERIAALNARVKEFEAQLDALVKSEQMTSDEQIAAFKASGEQLQKAIAEIQSPEQE